MLNNLTFLLPLLLLLPFFLMPACSSFMAEENPMQLLSDAELVRLAGYGEERLSSVLVTGSLVCEACLSAGSELTVSHVQGAAVAVSCRTEQRRRRRIRYANGTTDEFGEFIIDLPSQLHAIPKLEEACVVRILHMPRNSLCRHLSRGLNPAAKRIRLSSVGNSIRVYTTGMMRTRSLGTGKLSHHECLRKRDIARDLMQSSW
ncbi:uncharacterized protein LOC110032020 [Phalaenopsis equestris]|uniref:uncharacterized protein LOC110032020 n=1 Tax=Phalaenopsis equestris TaxID=78828 RepID=UPI0009E532E5|nr:uncharacterized protein LOC110032020 [Phalaenopsis equestris]